MYFDDVGLWKWHAEDVQDDADDDIRHRGFWQLLQSSTEEEIFEQIDLDWVDPTRRNLRFLS